MMKQRFDLFAPITIICMIITSLSGVLSWNLSASYDVINQYGQTIQMYGYGLYAHDSYFQAAISVGTDICILFLVVPMFIITYLRWIKDQGAIYDLKMISMYAITFYYAASIALSLTYNKLFLVYILLFSSSLFGMFRRIMNAHWDQSVPVTKGFQAFLLISGIALLAAWLPDVIGSLINNQPLSIIGVYTTAVTYVLDMGIISPLCFCVLCLMKRNCAAGTMLALILLKACLIVGIMMIPQTACQMAAGINIPIPALVTKSIIFLVLAIFAAYFERNIYARLKSRQDQ